MNRIRVLVVDDSAFNRKILRSFLEEMPEVENVETVSDGEEAIRVVMTRPPSVITLDVNMPKMDGFTFLRWLMRTRPLPVVMVSAEGDEKSVFKALDLGALDFVVKPTRHASERIFEIRSELTEKVRAVASKDVAGYLAHLKKARPEAAPASRPFHRHPAPGRGGVLVIGASTGGPSAVNGLLAGLPEDFPLAGVVVQHMPAGFTRQFAQRLDRATPFQVNEAEDGETLAPGKVLVAPGGLNLVLEGGSSPRVRVVEKEGDRYVPNVNRTMKSAAAIYREKSLGILLTGMGDDGAEGLLAIRQAGGRTIAESQESCVVYGMPRAAASAGAAERILPLERIAEEAANLAREIDGLKNARGGDSYKENG